MGLRELLDELKRRRVLRVLAAYLAAAFVVVQAADILVPALGLPPWALTLVVVLGLLGLPVAVALAWAFDWTADGVQRTPLASVHADPPVSSTSPTENSATTAAADPTARASAGALPRRRAGRLLLGAGLVVVGVALAAYRLTRPASPSLEADIIAILPFRVDGADPAVAYLREGMVDLLAAKLTERPRASDPSAVLAAWRRAAGNDAAELPRDARLRLARELGASALVEGRVVGSAAMLTVSASVLAVPDGRILVDEVRIALPADSLPDLVDRLTAALLSRGAGEAEYRLAQLTTTSLPALRAYLDGRAAYRRAGFEEAAQYFQRALQYDTAFALAALGLAEAANMTAGPTLSLASRGTILAWAARDRLSNPDLAYLRARLGPNYPAPSSRVERVAAWEAMVRSSPDRVEVWYELGDILFHDGMLIDLPDHLDRALAAFNRALELDPQFSVAAWHAMHAYLLRGDTVSARSLGAGLQAQNFTADRWTLAVLNGEAETYLAGFAQSIQAVDQTELNGLLLRPDFDDVARQRLALAEVHRRARTSDERIQAALAGRSLLLNRGWMGELDAEYALLGRESLDSIQLAAMRVADALFWSGDSEPAERAVANVQSSLAAAELRLPGEITDVCMLGLWDQQTSRRGAGVVATVQRLRQVAAGPPAGASLVAHFCVELLEAQAAVLAESPDARMRLDRLDSALREGPAVGELLTAANLLITDLFERTGQPERALISVRRVRQLATGGERYLSTFLNQRGRLAAQLGHREEAIEAYSQYLRLRGDADPALQPEVELARRALADLVAESGGR